MTISLQIFKIYQCIYLYRSYWHQYIELHSKANRFPGNQMSICLWKPQLHYLYQCVLLYLNTYFF